MYLVSRGGWSEVEGVVEVVCMYVNDEGCEVGIVVYDKDRDWVV